MNQELAKTAFDEGRYLDSLAIYRQLIEAEDQCLTNYWYAGTAALLTSNEDEAQTIWILGMSQVPEEETEAQSQVFATILSRAANQHEEREDFLRAWSLRQYIREFGPVNPYNLLALLRLSLELDLTESNDELYLKIERTLQQENITEDDAPRLVQLFSAVLKLQPDATDFGRIICALTSRLSRQQHGLLADELMPIIIKVGHFHFNYPLAIAVSEQLYDALPGNHKILINLVSFYKHENLFEKAIVRVENFCQLASTEEASLLGSYLRLRLSKESCLEWDKLDELVSAHKNNLDGFLKKNPSKSADNDLIWLLLNSPSILQYTSDNPRLIRRYQRELSQSCCDKVFPESTRFQHQKARVEKKRRSNSKIKIGYLSHCFNNHSVGWLSRWLIQNHDRERFETYAYFITQSDNLTFANRFFVPYVSCFYAVGVNSREIAQKIYEDEIDILIDLDSLTLDVSSAVLSLKPAPIQVTWLGFDASELPTIDYFIADPNVLPEEAEAWYKEKIWRLSDVYLAVDGFEVGVPSIKRQKLGIPEDSVVYLTMQNAIKLNTDVVQAQIDILRQVPNSYLLVKGLGHRGAVRSLFETIARKSNVSPERLRFLDRDNSELTHRANLSIADVILDTYPYNGATTNLEAMWMEIPIVTQMGRQFSSRNGYTFLRNAGIHEGVATSFAEYVDWGVSFGTDGGLRRKISQRLKYSKHSAPLWNSLAFTKEMENAFLKMWEIYCDKK